MLLRMKIKPLPTYLPALHINKISELQKKKKKKKKLLRQLYFFIFFFFFLKKNALLTLPKEFWICFHSPKTRTVRNKKMMASWMEGLFFVCWLNQQLHKLAHWCWSEISSLFFWLSICYQLVMKLTSKPLSFHLF